MRNNQNSDTNSLPRWVAIPIGLLLLPFTLASCIGSAALIFAPNIPPTFRSLALSGIFLAGSIWAFYISLRLVFINQNGNKKLISPLGLRVISLIFLAIPIISLLLGTFWEKPILYSFLTVAYISIFLQLIYLAKQRERKA